MATKSKRSRHTRTEKTSSAASGKTDAALRPVSAPRVDSRTATRHIRTCAAECLGAEARAALHALARAVRRGTGTPRRCASLAAAVAACLDETSHTESDRWAVVEAATWGLSRLVRSRRHVADSSGRDLERLVAAARAAIATLAERDTRPARFAIVLSRLFGDVEVCRDFGATAAAAVIEEIGRLVTAEGAVVLTGSAMVVDRVDRWAGIRATAAALGGPVWGDDVDRRWVAATAAAMRLLGPGGRRVSGSELVSGRAVLLDSLGSAAGKRLRRTAQLLRRGAAAAGCRAALLGPDLHDPAAATAIIRTGWGRDAVRVLLEYRDVVPHLEIVAGDRSLVEGPWEWGTTVGGRSLDAEGAWTVSGWESDRKAAFLEIAAPLAGGLRIERQVVVLRRQKVVLLADAIVPVDGKASAADAGITHQSAVRLAAALEAEPATETREVFVYDGGMRLMALPIALNEWRGPGSGDLTVADRKLGLTQSGHRRLYAPLWLDCEPRRIGQPLTWRQLTVADTRRNLPSHQAAGFRVQAGPEQWLLYRALDVSRNRTLLGCNVSSGFLLGRVKRSGEVARTVEIE